MDMKKTPPKKPAPIALATRAITTDNAGKAGDYAASLKFEYGSWCLSIECNMGAWAMWSLSTLTEGGKMPSATYIDFGSGFACTNMRPLIEEAQTDLAKMNRIEGECA